MKINVFQPSLGEEELAAVREVFASGWIGRGPRTAAFEEEFAEHLGVGAAHVTAVNSCTEGLFLAMELLGVDATCEVVLPTVSFVGAANAVAARGGRPVFCDVDPRTLNPTVADVASRLTARTRAVVILHYGGYPGHVVDIARLCRSRGIALIEDAACAASSTVDGKLCGTFGDIGVWSFDAMKILVTGDGGMMYCRSPAMAARAATLAYLGLDRPSGFSHASTAERWWEFGVSSFCRRSIMNDVTAAIGRVQLRRLPLFVSQRRAVARRYDDGLAHIPALRCPPPLPAGHTSSHLFYWIQVDAAVRDGLARRLYDRGVYTTFRYLPLHLIPIYRSTTTLPAAEAAARETLCIPIHQGLDAAAVDTVIDEIRQAVSSGPADREGAVEQTAPG